MKAEVGGETKRSSSTRSQVRITQATAARNTQRNQVLRRERDFDGLKIRIGSG